MRIRVLTKEDTQIYRELRLQALEHSPTAFAASYEEEVTYEPRYFENFLNNQNHIVFGAFEKEQLVGMVTLKTNTRLKLRHIASLKGIYVHQDYQGEGISKPIIAAAIMRAKELRCEQIHLKVNVKNQIAKGVYTSFGFEIIGMEKDILKMPNHQYIDEYHMALYFDEWDEA